MLMMLDSWMPLIVVLACAALGLALDASLRAFTRITGGRGWHTAESLLTMLRGVTILYALALGVYIAADAYAVGGSKGEQLQERLAIALCILASTIVGTRLAERSISTLSRHYGDRFPSASLFVSIARVTVIVIGTLIFLDSFNITVAPILTVLGTGGVAIALALQTTLANLFAGLQIIAARQVRPGDYIKLDDGSEGYIKDITWRNATIYDPSGNMIIVPNNKLATIVFTNYSTPQESMSLGVEVLATYGEDLAKIEQIAQEAARAATRDIGIPGREPSVQFARLSDMGVVLSVSMDIAHFTDRFTARSEFFRVFCTRCLEEKILLPCQPWASGLPQSPPA